MSLKQKVSLGTSEEGRRSRGRRAVVAKERVVTQRLVTKVYFGCPITNFWILFQLRVHKILLFEENEGCSFPFLPYRGHCKLHFVEKLIKAEQQVNMVTNRGSSYCKDKKNV